MIEQPAILKHSSLIQWLYQPGEEFSNDDMEMWLAKAQTRGCEPNSWIDDNQDMLANWRKSVMERNRIEDWLQHKDSSPLNRGNALHCDKPQEVDDLQSRWLVLSLSEDGDEEPEEDSSIAIIDDNDLLSCDLSFEDPTEDDNHFWLL